MNYLYFLSSLEVNSSKHIFHSRQEFSRWLYTTDKNYDYELIIFTPEEKEFEGFSKKLEINQKYLWNKFNYSTHVPIQVQIQKEYLAGANLTQQFSSFINNFLNLYQYFFNDYGIPSYKLDGRKIFHKSSENEDWTELEYTSLQHVSFFEHLQESIVYGEAATDLVCGLLAEKVPLEFNWTLLIDGIKFFYEGNVRQTLISCCTSVEVTVTQPVNDWLQNMTFTKGKELIDRLTLQIGNPLRFEFYINSINPEPFKIYETAELQSLISDLKSLNTIRNKVAHQGYSPSFHEAKKAIETTSLFLRALWVYERVSFYNELKKR